MSDTFRSRKETHQSRKKSNKQPPFKAIGITLGVIVIALLLIFIGINQMNNKEAQPSVENSQTSKSPSDASGNHGSEHEGEREDIRQGDVAVKTPEDENNADDNSTVSFAFVGDVMFASSVETYYLSKQGYDYPYTNVKPLLQAPDLTVANLETPITTEGEEQEKLYTYRSKPEALKPFTEAGFDVINVANNHFLDYGTKGMRDSFRHLQDAGLKYMGAGEDQEAAYAPVYVEKNGQNIAFLGFSRVVPNVSWKADKQHPGVAETYDYTRPVAAIKQAKEEADLVVVMAHWGDERSTEPNRHQTELAHRYIDAGADLVVGSHPHVLQGFEQYKGKWIAYSLGNFIFTTNENEETWKSGVLQAKCSAEGECDLSFVPVWNQAAQPKLMDETDAGELYQWLSDLSINATVNTKGEIRPEEN